MRKDGALWALGTMSGTSLDGVDAAMIKTDGHAVFAAGLEGEGRSGCDGESSTDDREGGQQTDLHVAQVHRSSDAARGAAFPAHDLGEEHARAQAKREREGVPAVGARDVVVGPQL